MINEKRLCAAMKEAYKGGGYTVYTATGDIYLRGLSWLVRMPVEDLPRKALALLVEHMAIIPKEREAYRNSKAGGVQSIIADTELEFHINFSVPVAAKEMARITKLSYDGRDIWQGVGSGQVLAVEPDYQGIVTMGADSTAYLGQFGETKVLVIDDGDISAAVGAYRLDVATEDKLSSVSWLADTGAGE